MDQLAPLALANLVRMRMRLLLTIGGVTIGTSAVILLIAFSLGLQNAAESGLGSDKALTQLYITAKADTADDPRLNSDDVKQLQKVAGVKAVIPEVYLQSNVVLSEQYTATRGVVGIDPDMLTYVGTLEDSPGATLALKPGEGISGAALGQNFGTTLSADPQGNPINVPLNVDFLSAPLQIQINSNPADGPSPRNVDVKIVGRFQPGTNYDQALIVPLADVMALNALTSGVKVDPEKPIDYDKITVVAESRDVTGSVSDAIENLGYSADGMGDILSQINSLFTTMRLVLGSIGLVALLVAASGVANTMMMATLERAKEIGLMKAVGATNNDILGLFLLEAGLIGLAGGLSGVGLSLAARRVINHLLRMPLPAPGGNQFIPIDLSRLSEPVIIPSNLMLAGIALAALICMAAGLYPALWAARLPPVVALKQE